MMNVENITFETLVENAVKIPQVKVNRNEFLVKTFEGENVDVHNLLDQGPVEASVSRSRLMEKADEIVKLRTSESAVASFAAGIPGGLAYALTIPADTIQFFAMTLRMAQEIAYIYGAEDFWKADSTSYTTEQLIFYMAAMFDVPGARATVRFLENDNGYQLEDADYKKLKEYMSQELVKKLTTDTAAKGISKIIPVIGGIVSGGYTYVTMQPMGRKLTDCLDEECFEYDERKRERDFADMQDVIAKAPEKTATASADDMFENVEAAEAAQPDAFEKIRKLAELKEQGIISEEEYNEKKKELLNQI